MTLLRHLIAPSGFFSFTKLIVAVLAFMVLFQDGGGYRFSSLFSALIKHYDQALATLLTPVEPYATILVAKLAELLDADFELFPHWRYIFVLLNAFLFSRIMITIQSRRYATALFRLVIVISCVGASSIAVGILELSSSDYILNFQVAFYPLLGLFFYHLLNSIWMISLGHGVIMSGQRIASPWHAFWRRLGLNLKFTVVGATFFLILLLFPTIRSVPSPGLLLLAIYMIGAAISYLWVARQEASALEKEKGIDESAYWKTDNALVGIGILNIFIWSIILIAIDVMLQMALRLPKT